MVTVGVRRKEVLERLGLKLPAGRLRYPGSLTHEQFELLRKNDLCKSLYPEHSPHGIYYLRSQFIKGLQDEFSGAVQKAAERSGIKPVEIKPRKLKDWEAVIRLVEPKDAEELNRLLQDHSERTEWFDRLLSSGELEGRLVREHDMDRVTFEKWLRKAHRLGVKLVKERYDEDQKLIQAGLLKPQDASSMVQSLRTFNYKKLDPKTFTHLQWLLRKRKK